MGYLTIKTQDFHEIWQSVRSYPHPLIVAADWKCSQAIKDVLRSRQYALRPGEFCQHDVITLDELFLESPIGTVFGREIIPRLVAEPAPGINTLTVQVVPDASRHTLQTVCIHLRRVPDGWEKT